MDGTWMGMGPSPYKAFDITDEVADMPKNTLWSTPGTITVTRPSPQMNSFSGAGAGSDLKVESIVVTRKK
jgi:hypothetical protein